MTFDKVRKAIIKMDVLHREYESLSAEVNEVIEYGKLADDELGRLGRLIASLRKRD